MLIQLTQRNVGAAGTPVAVNTDLIQRVEPVGDAGCTLHMQNGTRLDVLEGLDDVLDGHDASHDDAARKESTERRQKARKDRDEAKAKFLAENESARAQEAARRTDEESRRAQQQALAAAERAKAAARAAGMPERVVTSNVLPSGIDEKHPAPQPHQTVPVGTAGTAPSPVPEPAPDAAQQEHDRAAQEQGKASPTDRGPGGAFKDKGQAQTHKGGKSDKV